MPCLFQFHQFFSIVYFRCSYFYFNSVMQGRWQCLIQNEQNTFVSNQCVIHQFYWCYLMSRRTDFFLDSQLNSKQDLAGWEHETDDFNDNNNLLKILQKKITLPVIQSTNHKAKKFRVKLQTLPAVIEEPSKNSIDLNLLNVEVNTRMHELASKQKPKKQSLKVESAVQNKLTKCKTQKTKLSYLQPISDQIHPQLKSTAPPKLDQVTKQKVNTFNLSQFQFGEHTRNTDSQQKIMKRVSSNLIIKHKKIPSIELFPINHKNVDFEKSLSHNHIKNIAIDKKSIRWDRFSISQQKFKLKFEQSSKMNKQKERVKQKLKTVDKGLTNMLWMEKMLHRGKLDDHQLGQKRKILKTEANDYFIDDHLQSCQSQNQQTQFY